MYSYSLSLSLTPSLNLAQALLRPRLLVPLSDTKEIF